MFMRHYHLDQVNSTQLWAKELLLKGEPSPFVVTASSQTAGRSTKGSNSWHSPAADNLYATFGWLFPPILPIHISSCSLVVGLIVAELLRRQAVPISIKWPNDLLLNSKKVGGILIESISLADHTGLLIGLGLNTNSTLNDLKGIEAPATSLFIEMGQHCSVNSLLEELWSDLNHQLPIWQQQGFKPFKEHYKRYLFLKPGDLFLRNGEQLKYLDVAEDGALEVTLPSGNYKRLVSL